MYIFLYRSMMFLRLAVLFCVVCLASSETEKKSEDPPGLLQALNSKYFGHIRGKRTVSIWLICEDLTVQPTTTYLYHCTTFIFRDKTRHSFHPEY